MTYKKDSWIAQLNKAIKDTGLSAKPTAGLPCAVATIRYIRDGIVADTMKNGKSVLGENLRLVTDSCNELIKQLCANKGVDDGFASNASAAAKAAGHKSEADVIAALES
jgi:urease gamma subunit